MRYVLDCSAVINYLLDDGEVRGWVVPLFDAAAAGDVELHAPAYMLVEFVNVLSKKTHEENSNFTQDDARICLESLRAEGIVFHNFGPLETCEKLLDLTFTQNDELIKAAKKKAKKGSKKDPPRLLTVYDVVYFDLAKRLGATLVTSDVRDMKRLCDRAGFKCSHPKNPGSF